MMPFRREKTPVKTVALGGAVLVLISLVPWLGTSVLVLVAAISAGATLLSRLGRRIEVAV